MNFEDFLNSKYPNFKFIYDWEYHPSTRIVSSYLKSAMINSYNSGGEELRKELPDLIHDLEYFFYYGIKNGFFMKDNRFNEEIINRLRKKCLKIGYLPKELEGINGRSNRAKKAVEIRRKSIPYHSYYNLSPAEVRRLYLYHELGHNILNIYDNSVLIDFCKTYSDIMAKKGKKGEIIDEEELIYLGALAIEDCLTQELAEVLAFAAAKKTRPKDLVQKTELGVTFYSNHDYYGIYQEPVFIFGLTLKGCGNVNNINAVLGKMIIRALRYDFIDDLISEYNLKENGSAQAYKDLMNMLRFLGNLCAKKYMSFGQIYASKTIMEEVNRVDTKKIIAAIKVLSDRNRDISPYPSSGFPKMNLNQKNKELSNMLSENRIVKPRERKPYESDEEYLKYLEEFYKKKDAKNKK